MEITTVLTIVSIILIVGLFYLFYGQNKTKSDVPTTTNSSNSLSLQAYERMILLVDRIALPNLISRYTNDSISAREMQLLLTKTIREEFDYNITQQIYITPEVWNAVKGLKEKNLLIINQLAAVLPANASGYDLNKGILTFLLNEANGDLHILVSEALSFEAKKLL